MARLPTVGGDDGNWGTVLNEFLETEHNSDGTHSLDASEISYTPSTAGNWNGSADPGATDDGLDQLASRVKTIEGGVAGSDSTAIHDDVSGEINALTEKTTPVDNDLLIIEDSAASNAKKKLKTGNLQFSKGVLDFENNTTTRQYTGNNTWETVANTEVSFVATMAKHKILATFTYRFDRGGFWQILLNRIAGTNLGTTTPSAYTTEYYEGAFLPTTARRTATLIYILEPVIGNTVTLHLETNNSNTSNFITYTHTMIVAE